MNDTIFIYAPIPPPYSGPEISTELLLNELFQKHDNIIHIKSNVKYNNSKRGVFDFAGFYLFLKLYFTLLIKLIKFKPKVFYLLISSSKIGFLRDLMIIFTARFFCDKIVGHYRGGNFRNFYDNSRKLYKKLIKMTINKLDIIIIQAYLLKPMFDGIFENKVEVLYNGINCKEKSPVINNNKKTRLLFVGHISFAKGFYDLILVYKDLLKDYDVELFYSGTISFGKGKNQNQESFLSGDSLEYYKENIDKIEFTMTEFMNNEEIYKSKYCGIVKDERKDILYSGTDIFVLPSYTEGFPMTILESMSFGIPILSTRVGAIPEIITENENGWLVNCGDIDSLKKKLIIAICNKNELNRIGNNNYEKAKKEFDITNVSKKFYEILTEEKIV